MGVSGHAGALWGVWACASGGRRRTCVRAWVRGVLVGVRGREWACGAWEGACERAREGEEAGGV